MIHPEIYEQTISQSIAEIAEAFEKNGPTAKQKCTTLLKELRKLYDPITPTYKQPGRGTPMPQYPAENFGIERVAAVVIALEDAYKSSNAAAALKRIRDAQETWKGE